MSNMHARIENARDYLREAFSAHNISISTPTPAPVTDITSVPFGNFFDHTSLKTETSNAHINTLCDESITHMCASVCVPPNRVAQSAARLANSEVKVCTVIGFPNGYSTTATKVQEVRELRESGCAEFDMVQPIGLLYDADYYGVYCDVHAVVEAARPCVTKVILETALLSEEQKIFASLIAIAAGAHYLKTSTGFSNGGATLEDIALLRTIAGADTKVKAAGGIRDYRFACQAIAAGADRLGSSNTIKILSERDDVHGS